MRTRRRSAASLPLRLQLQGVRREPELFSQGQEFVERLLRRRVSARGAARKFRKRGLFQMPIGVLHLREIQPDGRIRHWLYIQELGKFLRVVTLADGETVHNAFPDRDFTEANI